MTLWLNHVSIAAPRNGTNSHTVDPAAGTVVAGASFTPTAGRLLVCLVEGPVTSTTPAGWTLPSGGVALNNSGLYLWYITAAGADTLSTMHNGSNYPVIFDIYEFAAGSTFVASTSSTGVSSGGGAGPTLSGLTGTNLIFGVVGQANGAGTPWAFNWDIGTEAVDSSEALSGTDGYTYSATYLEDSVLTSAAFAATSVGGAGGYGATCERLVFAVVAAAAALPTPAPFVLVLEDGKSPLALEDGLSILTSEG